MLGTITWSSGYATTATVGPTPLEGGASPGLSDRVHALGGWMRVLSPARRADQRHRGDSMRIVIGEDAVLLRVGLIQVLDEVGEDVVAEVR